MQRKGTIYTECHNKGRRRKGGVGGCVLRRGVGLVRSDIGGWNAQPVFAIDKDGNTVGWFASSYDAERKTGICARNIRAVLEGKRKHAGGYRWIRQN